VKCPWSGSICGAENHPLISRRSATVSIAQCSTSLPCRRTIVFNEHDANNFVYAESYLGIAHTDDLIITQITANDTRTVRQKQAFFASVVALLAENPGMRKEDVFINLVEVKKENWSFGNGVAQYV